MDFLCVCVRIPKAASTSLHYLLEAAFEGRQHFYVPHTLNIDGGISTFQELRFLRSRARHLLLRYGTPSIRRAFDIISESAENGDLIHGGHIDFPSVQEHLHRKAKLITIFREPAARCRSEYNWCHRQYLDSSLLKRFDSSARHKAAGRYSFDGYLDFLSEHRERYDNIAARYIGWDGEEQLGNFFEANVFHSGVVEESDAFERGLSEKMGVHVAFPRHNEAEDGETALTAEQRSRIERIYPLDFKLYEWQRAQAA
jgi:hypothetical protein